MWWSRRCYLESPGGKGLSAVSNRFFREIKEDNSSAAPARPDILRGLGIEKGRRVPFGSGFFGCYPRLSGSLTTSVIGERRRRALNLAGHGRAADSFSRGISGLSAFTIAVASPERVAIFS